MQVRHGFAGVGSVVEDQPVTILPETEFVGDFRGLQHQVSKDLVIFGLGLGNARNGLLRDDQNMRRCLWFDVAEGDHEVVLIDDSGGDFAGDDSFEQGFAHGT